MVRCPNVNGVAGDLADRRSFVAQTYFPAVDGGRS
jgi:hypothetical protein